MPKSSRKDRALVVAGDVTVDWLACSNVDWLEADRKRGTRAVGRMQNWQLRRGTRMEARPGGALLLAREVRLALQHAASPAMVRTHRLSDPHMVSPDRVLHSIVELEPVAHGGGQSLRVSRFLGYSGPREGVPKPLPVHADDPGAELVVLDDAGNGFRDHAESWPSAIVSNRRSPIVILKAGRPLAEGPLFERVLAGHRDRLIVVLNADDLRAEGVDLSRQLSWERTARDLVWQMAHNPDLDRLRRLPAVLIRFDLDGVIHYSGAGRPSARLYYDPAASEGAFRERVTGDLLGLTDVFVAALAARVLRDGPDDLGDGIREGILAARRYFLLGIDSREMDYPGAEAFDPDPEHDSTIADAAIPASNRRESADPDFWSLLTELRGPGLELLARQLVTEGETAALRTVPVGQFGDLRTVDRAEIESFRGIRNLIAEYLRRPIKRPLSIAVFGPPGSGKSFGVEQVARSVSRLSSARVEKLEFNLSQFTGPRDLTAAFHRVRDEVLRGRMPLVFFDEFDSPCDGPLGWLRSFLAPMQDGGFKDGEGMHPIGRAIFVFAGGLSSTLSRFARQEFDPQLPPEARELELRSFREAKGPDFVSRLRGYVNVLGPNPEEGRPDDRLHLIRRATILRALLLRNCPGLADPEKPSRLRLDEGVLRALIGVPRYRHGVRSMEAVLDMSRLDGRTSFEPSLLPPADQLDQHVDAAVFSRLVRQGVLFAAARDAIAASLHERYRSGRRGTRRRDAALEPWDRLDEVYRRSNLAQADDILRKLEAIGCGIRPRTGTRGAFRFSPDEIDRLAEREHARYVDERLQQGFRPGPTRNLVRKTSPFLVPWNRLNESARRLDRQAVTAIPDVLARAGFEVYRMA